MSAATACPSCRREVQPPPKNPVFPFCSARCRAIDLGRWLGESYRLPTTSPDEDEDGEAVRPPPADA